MNNIDVEIFENDKMVSIFKKDRFRILTAPSFQKFSISKNFSVSIYFRYFTPFIKLIVQLTEHRKREFPMQQHNQQKYFK